MNTRLWGYGLTHQRHWQYGFRRHNRHMLVPAGVAAWVSVEKEWRDYFPRRTLGAYKETPDPKAEGSLTQPQPQKRL